MAAHSESDANSGAVIGSDESSVQPLSPPAPKKAKRKCHFDPKWITEFQGIGRSSKGT